MKSFNNVLFMLASGPEIIAGGILLLLFKSAGDSAIKKERDAALSKYNSDPAVIAAKAKILKIKQHPNFGMTGLALPPHLFQQLKTAERVLAQRAPVLY